MDRTILDANIKEYEKLEREQNDAADECRQRIQELRDDIDSGNFNALINQKSRKIKLLKVDIQKQQDRHDNAVIDLKKSQALYYKKPHDIRRKNKVAKDEFAIRNSKDLIARLEKEIQTLLNEIKSLAKTDGSKVREEYEKIITKEETTIFGIEQYLKLEFERLESDRKYVESKEKVRKRDKGRYVFDPDIEEHQIKRALNTTVRERLSSITTIDENTLKKAQHIVRATHESGVDRANFLIKCRLFESKMEMDDSDEERYAETSEAMTVLSSWIAANAEEPDDDNTKEGMSFEGDKVETKQLFNLSMALIKNKLFLPAEKFDLAVAFFMTGGLEYCYDMFLELLKSPYTRATDKAEACKFLYYSGNDEYIPEIEKYTMEILMNDELADKFRYETIACYVTSLGLKTKYMNMTLATEGVDEGLVTSLFKTFVTLDIHPDYLILAYTFLLEQEYDESIKGDIELKLLEMAKSTEFSKVDPKNAYKIHRIRADAADVLVRNTDSKYHQEAFEIVVELGNTEEHEINRTVYTNEENVHLLNEKAIEYIEDIYANTEKVHSKIDSVIRDIEITAEKFQLTMEDRSLIRKSLDRIIMDSSKFTRHRITMTTILLCMYNEIIAHRSKKRLMARLLEELIDMAETCASGHAKRLVNTMVGYDDRLEGILDFTIQLESNIKARINTRLRDLEDEERQGRILEAMPSECEDRSAFTEFVNEVFEGSLRKELHGEFVVPGYVSQAKFNSIVDDVLSKL